MRRKRRFSRRAFGVTAAAVIGFNVLMVSIGDGVAVLALVDFWGFACFLPTVPYILSPKPIPPVVLAMAFLAPMISACAWGYIGGWLLARPVPECDCSQCGYSLTGNVSGVCPECGTRATP